MAKAYKCDMCGRLDEVDPVAILSLYAPSGSFYMENSKIQEMHNYELCARCLHKITRTKP